MGDGPRQFSNQPLPRSVGIRTLARRPGSVLLCVRMLQMPQTIESSKVGGYDSETIVALVNQRESRVYKHQTRSLESLSRTASHFRTRSEHGARIDIRPTIIIMSYRVVRMACKFRSLHSDSYSKESGTWWTRNVSVLRGIVGT